MMEHHLSLSRTMNGRVLSPVSVFGSVLVLVRMMVRRLLVTVIVLPVRIPVVVIVMVHRLRSLCMPRRWARRALLQRILQRLRSLRALLYCACPPLRVS